MKKFLLTLIVTMLAFVGTWAQETVLIDGGAEGITSASDFTLAAADVPSTIQAGDVLKLYYEITNEYGYYVAVATSHAVNQYYSAPTELFHVDRNNLSTSADEYTLTAANVADIKENGIFALNNSIQGLKIIKLTLAHYDAAESVSLNQSSIKLGIGSTYNLLTATVAPSTASQSVTWSVVEGSEYASVDANGVITGVAAGTATVRATVSTNAELYAECTVTVMKGYNLSIATDKATVLSLFTTTVTLTPTVTLEGESPVEGTDYTIAYALNNGNDDVTISGNVVTFAEGAAAGTYTVVATLTPTSEDYAGATATVDVVVVDASTKVVISVDADGVYKVTVPFGGAFGTQLLDDPVSGQTAPAMLYGDATLDGLKTAASVKVTGLLANSDIQELIHLIGDQTQVTTGGVCTSLDMSGSQLTESITAHNASGNADNPSISWIHDNDYWSHRLFYLEELSLPTPCPTSTTLPSNMSALWINNNVTLQSLVIPEGWTETAEKSFSDGTGNPMQKLTSLSLPNSLEKIGAYSFANLQVRTLYMPKNIKYIGDYAFNSSPKMSDIYFTGDGKELKFVSTTAFSTQSQMSNNSVTDNDLNGIQMPTVDRSRYTNGDVLTCIMHFPKGCDAEYTDVTREYTVLDTSGNEGAYPCYGKGNYTYIPSGTYADGTTWTWTADFMSTVSTESPDYDLQTTSPNQDGGFPDNTYGYSMVWPSQSQKLSGYVIANAGYLWNMQPMSTDQLDPENGVDKRGLYQFIVALGNAPKDKDKWVFPQNYEQNKWYTFSVPFDMSVEQIKNVFGATTQVCRISKVVRDIVTTTEGKEKKTLRLEFRNSVMQEGDGRTEDIDYADEVSQAGIRHHYPYMIKPGSAVSELQAEFKEDGKRVLPDYQTVPGNLMIETKIAVKNDNTDTQFEYMFCPILMEGKLKKNSYIFANYNNKHQFVFFKGVKNTTTNEYEDGGTANANTAYVQLIHGATDLSDFYVAASTEQGNQAPINATILGDDEAVNGIEEVVIVCGDNKVEDGKIYTINGVLVNSNSLPAGLYIKNGKKFIVK